MMADMRYPVDTEQTLYFQCGPSLTLDDVVDRARRHFPDCELQDLTISSENIQVKCFGYDIYDSRDYLDYIVVSRQA
jgi:hypothetical protein